MHTFTPVIGMEIHVELKTASKMFCGCKNDPFHAPKPNIYTCPVCLGMPGALPVPNRKAVEWTIMLGLALGCTVNGESKFDRKNYFYPDLPKGYQISQYDQPLCVNGVVHVDGGNVRIHRVHLEEDTGKLQHSTIAGKKVSLVDFNRSGVPLVEIVTEPDVTSGDHAKAFLKQLHQLITDLGISDAEMDKGSMRMEPNISVRKPGEKGLPPYKVEVKNINSFNYVRKAIEFEINRHTEILRNGGVPKQETRGWNEDKAETFSQRSKEEAEDYRYFPEPDIPPMRFTKATIDRIDTERKRLGSKDEKLLGLGLSNDKIKILKQKKLDELFFDCADQARKMGVTLDEVLNVLLNKPFPPGTTALQIVHTIASSKVFTVDAKRIDDAADHAIAANPKAVADFKSGKEPAIMFLLGQVLRELKGNADKTLVLEMLRKKLS